MHTLFSPIWPHNLTAMRVRSGKVIFSAVGREKNCAKCKEYWPADNEFFHTNPSRSDGLQQWCKACYAEWQRNNRLKKQEESACIH